MIRITSDIDNKNKLELAWYIYQALKNIKRIKSISIQPSQSQGYHLIIWSGFPYHRNQTYRLRKLIGDDKARINRDKHRKIGYQTLFNKKRKLTKVFFKMQNKGFCRTRVLHKRGCR